MPTFLVSDTLELRDSLRLISPEIGVTLIADALFLSDTVAAPTLGLTVLVSDSLTFTDSAVVAIKFELRFSDRLLLIDAVSVSQTHGHIEISVSDNLNFNDSLGSSNTTGMLVSDTLALSDLVGLMRGQISSDTLALSDAAAVSLNSIFTNLSVAIADSLSLSDTVQLILSKQGVAVGDRIQLSDEVFVALHSIFKPYLRRYLNDV